jgi:hypothetical protein
MTRTSGRAFRTGQGHNPAAQSPRPSRGAMSQSPSSAQATTRPHQPRVLAQVLGRSQHRQGARSQVYNHPARKSHRVEALHGDGIPLRCHRSVETRNGRGPLGPDRVHIGPAPPPHAYPLDRARVRRSVLLELATAAPRLLGSPPPQWSSR